MRVRATPTNRRTRPSPSRFETHFNLSSHFDWVAALDRRLIMKLRPRHGLTELHAGFELRDFPLGVDDDLATNRSAGRLPQGGSLNRRTLNQKSALFIRRNGDFGDRLLPDRGGFLRFRGNGVTVRGSHRPYPRDQEYRPGGIPFHSRSQKRRIPIDSIKGQAAPGHPDNTLAARLERIAVLALVGISNLVNAFCAWTPSATYSVPWTTSTAVRKNRR